MTDELLPLLAGEVLEEDVELSLADLCKTCRVPEAQVVEMVAEGIVEPLGREARQWRFRGASIRRVRCAVQLRHDLGVNWAGAALALELLDELRLLRVRLRRYED